MRAGVADAVGRVVVGPVVGVVAGVKGKLNDLHAGETRVGEQLGDLGRHVAQVLGDELELGEGLLERADQPHAGAGDPTAVLGRGLPRGHRPVALEAAEVVHADHVVQAPRACQATLPPGETVLLHRLVVVERVAPQLAVGREGVGRAAGDAHGQVLLVQLEAPGVGPDVGGVERHVDRQVADDADAAVVGVRAQGLPLAEEEVLDVGEEPDVILELGRVARDGLRAVHADALIGPVGPGDHAKVALDGHEERVVVEPGGVGLRELHDLRVVAVPAAFARAGEQVEAVRVEGAVVHVRGVAPPVGPLDLVRCEQAALHQVVEVDQVGVAGKGRRALIGGVAVARGAQGQHLPPGLVGLDQPVDPLAGGLAHGADAVGRGQRGHGHDDAARTFHVPIPSQRRRRRP